MSDNFLRVSPELRDILIIASANGAALALAYFIHRAQLALLVNIEPYDSEIFGPD